MISVRLAGPTVLCENPGTAEITAMSSAKEELTKLVQEQPEDSTIEEIVRELAFRLMVERGLADSDAGRTISNDEMARRIRSWPR
jgi:predicted transcriptional regulator